MQFMQHK